MDWTRGLNEEQIHAVEHNHGPLLILAGAGSGKTTVLVSRAGRLIDEGIVEAKKLCVLTFTNKAAKEMKTRVAAKLGSRAKGIWGGTFHSFGLQLLRKFHRKAGLSSHFGVIDQTDAGAVLKELLRDFSTGGKVAFDNETLLSMIGDWREQGRTVADKEDEYEEAVEWVLPRYLRRLQNLGTVDFDGLILQPMELMRDHPDIREEIQSSFTQVMVDEFQDTNKMQMELIRWLVQPHKNLAVVGDDDQAIYGWRGACISNILDFPKSYPGCKVVKLEKNYRSTPAILNLANAVIVKNTKRHSKILKTDLVEKGELPQIIVYGDENEEAESIGGEINAIKAEGYEYRDIALLYRSNSQGAMLEAELRKQQIPYLMSGGTGFFDRKETRDILAYIRCSLHPNEVALRRILNTPSRGIGEKTIDTLAQFCHDHNVKFLEAAKRWREANVEERCGKGIDSLFVLLDKLPDFLINGPESPGTKLTEFLLQIGYKTHLEKIFTEQISVEKRWRMVDIFAGILDRYVERGSRTKECLRNFIDAMELRDTLHSQKEEEDRVQMLTLHACKGLEFPVVYLLGVEEDLLPHKTLGTDISEERRLFYVGVTRARKRLYLTRARKRRKYGKMGDVPISRFLLELPKGLITEREGPRPVREEHRKSMIADLFKKLDALDAEKGAFKPR